MEDNKMEEKINMVLSLLKKITDDGKITEDKVNELRKHLLNEDGSYNINREVADDLFNLLNMAKNKEVIHDSFGKLFINAVCAYLLKDKSSTGVLDDEEVDWLVGKIESDLDIDDTVFDLIKELKDKSYNYFPEKLDSAIILGRLREILGQLLNSEDDNKCKEEVEKSIEYLSNFIQRRKKVSIDEDCVTILFSIKKKLIQNKRLGFDFAEKLDKKETAENKFAKLFYDIVSAYVLYDEHSPYDIDDKEAKRLMARINQKATADSIDKALLEQLKSKSMGFPELLAKARFDISTSEVRTNVVTILAKEKKVAKEEEEKAKKEEEEAKKLLDKYLSNSFGCTDEQKLKAELLFDLKNLTGPYYKVPEQNGNSLRTSLRNKFIDCVVEYITGKDSTSPNEIDEEDEVWLNKKLSASATSYYACDEDLLKQLKKSSVNFPESLALRLSKATMKKIMHNVGTSEMKEWSEADLIELKDAIFDDNDEFKIDPRETAEFIFKIKDIIYEKEQKGDKKCNEVFKNLFINVVSKYLLEDKQSLGRVDKSEEEWLLAKIQSNGALDIYDEKLLDELEKRSINPSSVLHRTEKHKRVIGTVLYHCRKISYVAVIGSLIASLVLFVIGASHIVKVFIHSFQENVMVVDSSSYNSIKSDAGISGNDVRFKKVLLYVGGNSYKFKNVRLVVKPYNKEDLSGGIMMGVHNTKKIIKKKPDKYHQREGLVKADKVYLSGISNGSGILGHKSNIEISVDSLYLAKRDRLSMHSSSEKNTAFVEIIEAVDAFLVALVVFILGIGIYELFIRKLEKPYKIRENRPSWMQMSSIDDLKSSLVKVLIIAMIVGFYKRSLLPDFKKEDLLFLAIGIVLIAIAFCVTEISAHYHNKSKEENSKQIQSETNKEKK